jgi:hypothetical protein
MTLTAETYVQNFLNIGRRLICMPAPHRSIMGDGYSVGMFDDGCVLRVGDSIIEHNPNPDGWTFETLARVGLLLAKIPQTRRATQLAEIGCKPGETITLNGTRWNSAGEYLGLTA